ncbi:hypothetical protein EI94DRAFT_1811904 [Lactarius quietus]|nr:hypothetical protein EI94DRAFT_1811904 [Lactarius quietus]
MPDNEHGTTEYKDEDDKKLEAMGYVPSFKREFSNLATLCIQHHGPVLVCRDHLQYPITPGWSFLGSAT